MTVSEAGGSGPERQQRCNRRDAPAEKKREGRTARELTCCFETSGFELCEVFVVGKVSRRVR